MTSPTLSDVELTFKLSTEIETALVERGASGSGLREKAMCFEAYLPSGVWNAIRTIGRERNHLAHVHLGTLSDREGYIRACEFVLRAVRAIPARAVATLPPPRPGFRSPYPQRAHRSAASSLMGGAGRVVQNHVRREPRHAMNAMAVFVCGVVGLFIIVVVSAINSSRPLRSQDVKAPEPSGNALTAPNASLLSSPGLDTSDHIGGRSAEAGRGTRKGAKNAVAAPDRIVARPGNSNSRANGPLLGALPASPQDALPRLEGSDSSGQQRAADPDLALGKLGVTAAPADPQKRTAHPAAGGTIDLRSQDLDKF